MLQTIVGNDQIACRMRRQQRARRRHAVAPDKHRAAAAPLDQQRFVAHILRPTVAAHFGDVIAASPVASAD